jgi:hypothetical protein
LSSIILRFIVSIDFLIPVYGLKKLVLDWNRLDWADQRILSIFPERRGRRFTTKSVAFPFAPLPHSFRSQLVHRPDFQCVPSGLQQPSPPFAHLFPAGVVRIHLEATEIWGVGLEAQEEAVVAESLGDAQK